MIRVGVVDTSFARVDMGRAAEEEIKRLTTKLKVVRRTVPGIKDLAVECKVLIEREGCEACMALGMPGRDEKDKLSALVASYGIMMAQLMTGKHILEVFVHEEEAESEAELVELCRMRAKEHARNLVRMLLHPEDMLRLAGTGQREGFPDVGSAKKLR